MQNILTSIHLNDNASMRIHTEWRVLHYTCLYNLWIIQYVCNICCCKAKEVDLPLIHDSYLKKRDALYTCVTGLWVTSPPVIDYFTLRETTAFPDQHFVSLSRSWQNIDHSYCPRFRLQHVHVYGCDCRCPMFHGCSNATNVKKGCLFNHRF